MANDLWYVAAPYYDMAMHNAWVDVEISWVRDGHTVLAKGRVVAHLPLITVGGPGEKLDPARLDATLDQPVASAPICLGN